MCTVHICFYGPVTVTRGFSTGSTRFFYGLTHGPVETHFVPRCMLWFIDDLGFRVFVCIDVQRSLDILHLFDAQASADGGLFYAQT